MEKWVISLKHDNSVFDAVRCADEDASQDEVNDHIQSHFWTGVTRVFVGQPGDASNINEFANMCVAGKVAPHTTF